MESRDRWSSAVAWTLIFCALDVTGMTHAFEVALRRWCESGGDARSFHAMPPGITDGVKVLLAGLWHMAAVLITAPFWIAGLLLVALVGWLERVGALPAIGFLIGVILCPGAPLWRSVAHRLGRIGSVIGASGFEVFTLRGRANKVWAATPIVLAAILAFVVWPTFFHTFTRNLHAPHMAIEKSASTH